MAQRQQVVLISDLTGDEIVEGGRTVRFSVSGIDYEIDLTDKEAAGFDKAIAMYVEHGRRVGGRRTRGSSGRGKTDKEQVAAIRQWAQDNGYEVSSRGRIPANILEAYNQAS